MVKHLPAMWETWVQSLGQEDPLEEEMSAYSRVFLPGEFHGWRRLVGYSPWGHKELDTTEQLHFTSLYSIHFKMIITVKPSYNTVSQLLTIYPTFHTCDSFILQLDACTS